MFLYSHGYVVPGSSNPAMDVGDLATRGAGRWNGELLCRTFVARAGHCAFTPAETIAAVQTLLARLETGRWPDIDASTPNTAALSTGPAFNIFAASGSIVPTSPAFVDFRPSAYLCPFDGEAQECEFGGSCDERASRDIH